MTSLLPPVRGQSEIEQRLEREIIVIQQYAKRRFRLTVAAATIIAALIGAATVIGTSLLQRGTRDEVAELQRLMNEQKGAFSAIEARIEATTRSVEDLRRAIAQRTAPPPVAPPKDDKEPNKPGDVPLVQSGANFSGKWEWPGFGRVRLRQNSDGSVTGEYSEGSGNLAGRVVNDKLEFAWWQPDKQKGNGYVRIQRSGAGASVLGRWCIGVTCDPDDPRQDRRIDGTTTDW